MRFKKSFTDPVPESRQTGYDTAGIEVRLNRRGNLEHSAFKVLIEESSGRIMGAHLLGTHAEETINLFALAIRAGLKADDLREMIYAYPTNASDIVHLLN